MGGGVVLLFPCKFEVEGMISLLLCKFPGSKSNIAVVYGGWRNYPAVSMRIAISLLYYRSVGVIIDANPGWRYSTSISMYLRGGVPYLWLAVESGGRRQNH